MKKLSTYVILGLSILCLLLLFFNFKNDNHIPTDYKEMTAGQVLDIKIDLDNQIGVLDTKRKEVVKIYNDKRGFVEVPVVEVKVAPETPITQLNKEMGLK